LGVVHAGAERLLERLKALDPSAQSAFWREKRDGIYAICAHVLGRGDNAQEVTDDVLVDFLFRYVHHVSDSTRVDAYIRLMAARRAVRFRNMARRVHQQDMDEHIDGREIGPEDRAILSNQGRRVVACMSRLTPKARRVLDLRFRSDLTNDRIGELLGGSKQYIGRLIKRSLELLQQCMNEGRQIVDPSPTEGEAGDAR
jgi:RNA polymerase sigma factor (sigma-70 family)